MARTPQKMDIGREKTFERLLNYWFVRSVITKGAVMKKLTKEQTEELNQLALWSDKAIDTSDIPEQTRLPT